MRRLDWNPVGKQRRRLARLAPTPILSVSPPLSQQAFVKHTTDPAAKYLDLINLQRIVGTGVLEGCRVSANKTREKDKKLWGGAAGETNVLSAINLNFSVQFIAI